MKLNRCPGFRYGPKLRIQPYNGTTLYRVEQKGFWMDASIVGPIKPNEAEAIKAWNRLIKAKAAVEYRLPNMTCAARGTGTIGRGVPIDRTRDNGDVDGGTDGAG